jgi:hypothetical protein
LAIGPKRKIRTGAKLDGLALRRKDVWAWDFVHDSCHNVAHLLERERAADHVAGEALPAFGIVGPGMDTVVDRVSVFKQMEQV